MKSMTTRKMVASDLARTGKDMLFLSIRIYELTKQSKALKFMSIDNISHCFCTRIAKLPKNSRKMFLNHLINVWNCSVDHCRLSSNGWALGDCVWSGMALQLVNEEDLTGLRVTSTQRVAVLAVVDSASDVMMTQLTPVNHWQSHYLDAVSPAAAAHSFRLLGITRTDT